MKRLEAVLDQVLEKALEKALASLEVRATAIVEETLSQTLEAKLKALLAEEAPAPEAPTRAKAKAKVIPLEATPAKAPRRRGAKAQATPEEDNLAAILDAAKVALAKYAGVTTPRGKELPDVLLRRVRKTLEHAQSLGRGDLRLMAQRALAIIDIDPRGVAMGSWKALAERLGLPVHVGSEE
jgi:hypothetical protein